MEKTWEFDTTTGEGSEIVTVVYEYENDGKRFGLRVAMS